MAAFEDCLAKGRLKKIDENIELVAKEFERAKDELERARTSVTSGNWNDTAMQSYFAMTRCARAAIKARGYKDTNLYGLQVGLGRLWVETGELYPEIGKQISDAKDVKDAVYNGRRATQEEAQRLLGWAQDFAKIVFTHLALPGFDPDEIKTDIPSAVQSQPETSGEGDAEEQPLWSRHSGHVIAEQRGRGRGRPGAFRHRGRGDQHGPRGPYRRREGNGNGPDSGSHGAGRTRWGSQYERRNRDDVQRRSFGS